MKLFLILIVSLIAMPASAQQMMGPGFNLTPETRAIWAEQYQQVEDQIAHDNAWKHTPSPEYLARQERSSEQAREAVRKRWARP